MNILLKPSTSLRLYLISLTDTRCFEPLATSEITLAILFGVLSIIISLVGVLVGFLTLRATAAQHCKSLSWISPAKFIQKDLMLIVA